MITTNIITAAEAALEILKRLHADYECPEPDHCPDVAAIRDLSKAITDIHHISATDAPPMTMATFSLMTMAIEAQCVATANANRTIELLIEGGFITAERVDEARRVVKGCSKSAGTEASYPPMKVSAVAPELQAFFVSLGYKTSVDFSRKPNKTWIDIHDADGFLVCQIDAKASPGSVIEDFAQWANGKTATSTEHWEVAAPESEQWRYLLQAVKARSDEAADTSVAMCDDGGRIYKVMDMYREWTWLEWRTAHPGRKPGRVVPSHIGGPVETLE